MLCGNQAHEAGKHSGPDHEECLCRPTLREQVFYESSSTSSNENPTPSMRAIAGKLAAVRPASLLARARVCAAHTPGPQARSQLPAGAAAWACRGGGLLSRPQAHAAHGHGARLLHGTARAQQDTTGKGTGDEVRVGRGRARSSPQHCF